MYFTKEQLNDCVFINCIAVNCISSIDWVSKQSDKVKWDISDSALKMFENATKERLCGCPAFNFSFNGIGCTCGGK